MNPSLWSWPQLAGFAALGAGLGAFGTLIGAGGGFLLVPTLLILGWRHEEAAATSLLMVAANAASGSLSYYRQRLIDLASAWRFALCTLPGALLGARLGPHLSGRAFSLIFAALLLALAANLLLRPGGARSEARAPHERPPGWRGLGWTRVDLTDARGHRYRYGYAQPYALLLSVGVGFLSSILGIGGGIIHVPALIRLFSFPAHVATATSHCVLAVTAAAGTAENLLLGHVRLPQGLILAAGAIFGAQVGGRLARRVRDTWIVRALGAALLLVAARLVYGALRGA